jgi:hypothetical protein
MVEIVTVAGSTGSLNVTVRAEEIGMSVAPLAGIVALTEGGLTLPIPVVPVPGELPPHARRVDPKRITSMEKRRWYVSQLMKIFQVSRDRHRLTQEKCRDITRLAAGHMRASCRGNLSLQATYSLASTAQ